MIIKKLHISIVCFFILGTLTAQVNNPFEIQERLLKDSSLVNENKTEKQQISAQPGMEVDSSQSVNSEEDTTLNLQSDHNAGITNAYNPFEIIQKSNGFDTEQASVPVVPEKKESIETATEKVKLPGDESKNDNFIFWLILFAFLILAVALSLDRWLITKLFRSILNYNLSNNLMRENSGLRNILLGILYLLFILSFSLFVFLLQRHFSGLGGMDLFLYCLAGVTGIYIVRHLALHLFQIIFPYLFEAVHFSFNIVSFNIIVGILLLIPILFMAFSATPIAFGFLILGLIIFGAMYILRSFRGLLLAFKYINNYPIHFFLYLCAFEIIPLMVLYKILTDFV